MEYIFSLEEIETIAERILKENTKRIILFNGEMGAGKTTFIKALSKKMGVNETMSSPTFSLVNEYKTIDNQTIYHFDFYRLKSETEALDMGIEDYFYSDNWCFIEWSEKIKNLIPTEHSTITIELEKNGKRRLKLS